MLALRLLFAADLLIGVATLIICVLLAINLNVYRKKKRRVPLSGHISRRLCSKRASVASSSACTPPTAVEAPLPSPLVRRDGARVLLLVCGPPCPQYSNLASDDSQLAAQLHGAR